MRRLLIILGSAAVLLVPAAALATAATTYPVAASSSRSAAVRWTTVRGGNLTMTLRYNGKGQPAFNAYATDTNGSPWPALNGICTTTTGSGFITYSCVNAPASSYEADIWPSKGQLSGTLTVTGETD